jgi:hypothetical protein
MNHLRCLPILVLLNCPFIFIQAQEQVSFVYDNNLYNTYPVSHLYDYNGTLRYLSVEYQGEIIISAHTGTMQDTLLMVQENETERPKGNSLKGNKLAQFFEEKIILIDLLDLTINEFPLSEPGTYDYSGLINDHYAYYYNNQDTIRNLVRLEDGAPIEVPVGFSRDLGKDYIGRIDSGSSPKQLLSLETETGTIDTLLQSSSAIYLDYHQGYIFVFNNDNLWKYDPSTNSLQNIYSFMDSSVKDFTLYRDEILIVENTPDGAAFKSLDLDGIQTQSFMLSDTIPTGIHSILAKDNDGNYIYRDYYFDLYRMENQETVIEIPRGYQSRVFEGGIDSVFYYFDDQVLSKYDANAQQFAESDSILSDYYTYFEDLFVHDGVPYLIIDDHLFADLDQQEGMEEVSFRTHRPEGLDDLFNFLKTGEDLYIVDNTGLYWFNGSEFERLEGVQITEPPAMLDQQIYFSGKVNGDYGFYRIENKTEPVLVQDTGRDQLTSASGDYLLFRNNSWGDVDFYVLPSGDDTTFTIEFPDISNMRILKASIENSMFVYKSANDTTTLWHLNLDNKIYTEIFKCSDIGTPYTIQNRLILPFRDFDEEGKLLFFNNSEGTLEIFDSDLTDPFIGIYRPNCDQSLLFEIYAYSGGVRQIWSTDGTLQNTVFQVENAPPYLLEYFDLGIHKNEDQLFFSIRTSETELAHYQYDCETRTLELEEYPSDLILARRFNAGNSTFGISIQVPGHDNHLIDITDPTNLEYISELDFFRNSFVWIGVGTGFIYNLSEGLPFKDSTKTLAILNIAPFGQELYYVYEDGTLEQIADINSGLLDAFPGTVDFHSVERQTPTTGFQNYLFFGAHNRLTGHQVYRLPLENLIGTSTTSLPEAFPLSLSLFPNPTDTDLTMTIAENGSFKWFIYSNSGMLKRSGEGQGGNLQLDVADLPDGVYYFFIEMNGRRLAKAFTKTGR